MVDPRIKKLADILVNFSIKVKKGNIIQLNFGSDATPLALECMKLILKKGAMPKMNASVPGLAYTFYKHASEKQLSRPPKLSLYEARNVDGTISIGAAANTKSLTNIDPKKIAIRQKAAREISQIILKKNNWVVCHYPTHALAQDAEMSLDEFEDFAYNATNIDWKKEEAFQKKVKKILDKGNHVRIVGKDTDIEFSIKNRQGILCCGHRNMPDGEVFIAPVETSTKGHIAYSYPAIRGGKEVDGIKLEFKKGVVVKATASKNQDLLHEMLKLDKGAKYLGEFGIGTNFGINKFIKQILFDEKIGGTIHLALGNAYKEGGGRNTSILHWDMIKDLRKNGAVYIDGKCIQKNGKFRI